MRLRIVLLVGLALVSCRSRDDQSLMARSRRVFGPLPAAGAQPAALVDLGRQLYHSNELSLNRTQSCDTCHPASLSGADGRPTSVGALGRSGRRNAPTVLNARYHIAQFWDGRATTLEQQASGPVLNPVEMAMPDAASVAERLRTSPAIDRALFRRAFPGEKDPLTLDHAARAIAAFERTLGTEDRFDRFQKGDRSALTPAEKKGLQFFLDTGCASCHNGPLLGANKFMKIGLVHPYQTSDLGRYEITRREGDSRVFKVPSLRNVSLTAPYFHDGRIPRLPDAVARMAWLQLGKTLTVAQRESIAAFLGALADQRLVRRDATSPR